MRSRKIIRFIVALTIAFLWAISYPVRGISVPVHSFRFTLSSTQTTDNLVQQGQALYAAGQFSQAISVWQQAVDIYRASGNELKQAGILSNLALAYQQLGQWRSAERAIKTSLDLLQTKPKFNDASEQTQILAQTLNIRGSLELAQGQAQAALTTWQKTADVYARLGDETGVIRSQINQAQAQQTLGLYRQAQKTLTSVQQTLKHQPDSSLKALGLRSLGNVLRATGDLAESYKILEQSLAIATTLQSPQAEGETLLELGNTARAQQEITAASEFYQQAAATSPNLATSLQAQSNQLSLSIKQDYQPNRIADLWWQIKSKIGNLPPSRTAIDIRLNLAQSLMQLDDNQKLVADRDIAEILATAVQQAQALKDPRATSSALGNLGNLYEHTQQRQEAIDLTQQALLSAQTIDASELTYRWQWQLGRLQKQQGNAQAAIAAYDRAVKDLKSIRNDLVAIDPDVQFDFREKVEPVYREYVNLLLQPVQPTQKNLLQARYTIEALQLAELDNYFREPCLEPLQEIDVVDQKAAIVYPIILEDRLEVILSLPGQNLRHYSTKLRSSEVQATLESLKQKLVLPYTSASEILPLSQTVYSWLVQPAAAALANQEIKTLVFVLDGSLRSIPMTALHDGNQYLVEKYNVALTQGLQLFEPRPLAKSQLKALTAGLTQERFGFSPLPYVEPELKQIQTQLASKVLLNREFTSESLDREMQSSLPVVHLATHGQFSSQAEDTFILAWDESINVNELDNLLRTRDASTTSELELLVLSACETAAGDDRATLGLAGVAVRAGARSTLASLWLVDDESTSILMNQFYQELTAGVSKAEALRHAQLSLLQGKYQHPRFWSAFILLGNWL